jgi:hypothetical protein
VQTLLYPFCVTRFSEFATFGRMRSHEDVRNSGQLHMLDTWALACEFAQTNRVLFVSQCVEILQPAPLLQLWTFSLK